MGFYCRPSGSTHCKFSESLTHNQKKMIKNNSFILKSIHSLINWIEQNDYSSYDHYDFWSSKIGIVGRRIFSMNKLIGMPIVALLNSLDVCLPQSRKIFAMKDRSAEAIPRIAVGYFRLYKMTNEMNYLDLGCKLLDWLKENASNTKHGCGWGLHFDWEGRVFVRKGTPCVTLTAYATEAFLEGYRLTKEEIYRKIAEKTGEFVAYDLNRKVMPYGIALSYTPTNQNYVVNANSYAARILVSLMKSNNDDWMKRELVEKITDYIVIQQNSNGSWFYFDREDVQENRNFIDSFHTCFVLENLYWIWKWNKSENLKNSIDKGYEFFINQFITTDHSVRYYYYYPYPHGIKVDIRGCAETIYCLTLLSDLYPEAINIAQKVAKWTINNMQDKKGFFYFRTYRTHRNKFPYVRWGQAPMFNALTFLLSKLTS